MRIYTAKRHYAIVYAAMNHEPPESIEPPVDDVDLEYYWHWREFIYDCKARGTTPVIDLPWDCYAEDECEDV